MNKALIHKHEFMEERQIPCYALLSVQRALLGVITPNIRHISMEWVGFESARLRVYYDSPPTDEEVEEMDSVGGQVLADVPFHWMEELDVRVTTAPMDKLESLARPVYYRKEPIKGN